MHAYTHMLQADAMVGTPRLDEEVLNSVVELGFDRDMLLDSLRGRQQNKATVTYHLMADNRCVFLWWWWWWCLWRGKGRVRALAELIGVNVCRRRQF
jgi:hypothetical protein